MEALSPQVLSCWPGAVSLKLLLSLFSHFLDLYPNWVSWIRNCEAKHERQEEKGKLWFSHVPPWLQLAPWRVGDPGIQMKLLGELCQESTDWAELQFAIADSWVLCPPPPPSWLILRCVVGGEYCSSLPGGLVSQPCSVVGSWPCVLQMLLLWSPQQSHAGCGGNTAQYCY